MKSLQSTIFVFFVVLLLAVQAVFLRTIYEATRQQEERQVEYRLSTAQTVFTTQFKSRSYYLAAFAETAAKDFGLKQVFLEDTRSFMVALNNHRQRIDADIAIAVSAEGKITAQLVNRLTAMGKKKIAAGPEIGSSFQYSSWLQFPESTYIYPLKGDYFQISLAPLKSGASVIGWVGFGYQLDTTLAEYFSELTGLNTIFAIEDGQQWRLLASSTKTLTNKPGVESQLVKRIMQNDIPRSVIATSHIIGEVNEQRLVAIMHGNRADLLAAIHGHWWELGLLAALTLCLSLAGAYFIAARISRPVKELVRQAKFIAGGNYEIDVDINTSGELQELAEEFKNMQKAVLSREQLISHQAYHDTLTNLPNRNRLIQVLDAMTEVPQRPFSLSLLSIQRINDINSSLGHDIGDQVIQEVGKRLSCICESDSLFHLSGSLFVILNSRLDHQQVDNYVRSVMQMIETEYHYQSISLYLEIQIGITFYPEQDLRPGGLLQKAAIALQAAQAERIPYKVYDSLLAEDSVERLQLINDLKFAIENNQLVLHFQPKLDMAQQHISAVEALVRWNHPQNGMIPPDKFISVAEQTGMINALSRWVVQTALQQYRQWQSLGINLPIAVNISAENLKDESFYSMVKNAFSECQLNASALTLEITESAVMDDPKAAIALLGRFEADGIKLSIDDYGTGYSSLEQLKQMPVHELKIDKSFVMTLLQSKDDQIIVRSTIELAHSMGLSVVAEGIEDQQVLHWLREHGCDKGQGYFICRPMAAADLEAWLGASEYFQSTRASSL